MPTLQETINAQAAQTIGTKLSRCKPVKNMNISASVDVKKSANFHLVNARISKLPMIFAAGASEDGPIVLDRNYSKIGKLNCEYIPKVIVLSGRKAMKAAKQGREAMVAAWVGDGALKPLRIMAADALSNSDIESKLSQLIRDAYPPKKVGVKGDYAYDYPSYPYLRDVFQGDSYCVFQTGKAMFRQNYKIDPKTRNVSLDGQKIQVYQSYSPAPTGDVSSAARVKMQAALDPMSQVNDGLAPAKGGFNGPMMNQFEVAVTTFGAPNSEANNPQLKLMLNVEEALEQYLAVVRNGIHKPVSMMGLLTPPAYVNAARETTIAVKAKGEAVPKTFSTMDFLKWQNKQMTMKASMQTKTLNGESYVMADFAYVGDPQDISTWHLPIASKSLVASSLELCASCTAIPKFERAEVKEKIVVLAEGYGISAGGPGSGRKPGWQSDSPDKDKLNDFHKQLTKKGYKYKSSGSYPGKKVGTSEPGAIAHHYKDKSGADRGTIVERKNGQHSAVSNVGEGNWYKELK